MTTPTPQSALAAMDAFDKMALETNLEEVTNELLTVGFMEYDTVQEAQPDGTTLTRNKPRQRLVEIDTYASMDALNYMLLERSKITPGDPASSLDFQARTVLYVWKMTEPDMTLERLKRGLTWKKINALFFRFFNTELRQLAAQAQTPAMQAALADVERTPAE